MRNRVGQWVALALVLIVATGLRFYRLDAQSFWNDEGNSARIAERSLALITEGAAGDIHPPLYYYLLHFWRGAFGSSEFALRSLSAVLGILLVGLTYLIARQVFDHGVGVLAALIAAINPFQVYYSQEARMYMLLAVIGAAATWVLLSLLVKWSSSQVAKSRRIPFVIAQLSLVILYAAGLYTHYAFPFIIATHFVIVLTWIVITRRSLRSFLPWIGTTAAAGVLFIPWLPIAIRQITTWPSSPSTIDAGAMLLDTARLYVLGPTFPTSDALAAIVISGFFLMISVWNPHGFDERRAEDSAPLPHSVRVGAIGLWWLIPDRVDFWLWPVQRIVPEVPAYRLGGVLYLVGARPIDRVGHRAWRVEYAARVGGSAAGGVELDAGRGLPRCANRSADGSVAEQLLLRSCLCA